MIPDCKQLIHPFQTDPGVSQRQRLSEDLLSGPAQVDARSLADLLDFFVQLSRHVNYYDEKLQVSDWQPFFQKSLPFSIASIIRYDRASVEKKLLGYKKKFDRNPSAAGLQLLLTYTYNSIIRKIDGWQKLVSGSGFPLETALEQLVRDKLSDPVKEFIRYANDGTQWFCTRNFNFNSLFDNPVWGLDNSDLRETDEDFKAWGNTKRKRLVALYNKTYQLVQSFLDVIRIFSTSAELSLEQSLLPLKEELKEKHTPHLALLFAFLKLFQYLQGDLNSYTKRHLDFFYKQVLLLKPKAATPDKIHLVFEIQQQLEKYLLKKGLLFKDGKDSNKAEVFFSTEDEIVVNKAKVADQRLLFLNNQVTGDTALLEGVYMAPDATKSNGVDKEFKDEVLPSRAALGAKWSKYIDPENKYTLPYPNARLGFLLASPVLLLNEGRREISILLSCKLDSNYCQSLLPQTGTSNTCCDESGTGAGKLTTKKTGYPPFLGAELLISRVATALNTTYYYISRDILAQAVKKGIGKNLQDAMDSWLTVIHTKNDKDTGICYCERKEKIYEATFTQQEWEGKKVLLSAEEKKILAEIIKPRKPLNVVFSGEEAWIAPYENIATNFTVAITNYNPGTQLFTLDIKAILEPDQKAVTFYNAEKLKEDFNTTLPVARLELDDKIKIEHPLSASTQLQCCERKPEDILQPVSLYHFFRNVRLLAGTKIDVKVCGVKKLIVQNDESLQDVNAPIYAFGSRPKAGASFYIGSKELFSKDWTDVWVNAEWKDRPLDFKKHYEHYSYKNIPLEDGVTIAIVEGSFKITASVLDQGVWKKNGQKRLFKKNTNGEAPVGTPAPDNRSPFCSHPVPFAFDQEAYDYAKGVFLLLSPYQRRKDLLLPLEPLNVGSQYGFFRFTLDGLGFQHDAYPFVLTRQMMAYANLVSPEVIGEVLKQIRESQLIINAMINGIANVALHVGHIQNHLSSLSGTMTALNTQLGIVQGHLSNALITSPIGAVKALVTTAQNVITNQVLPLIASLAGDHSNISSEVSLINTALSNNPGPFNPNSAGNFGIIILAAQLKTRIDFVEDQLKVDDDLKDGLPKEPYTPVIKSLSIDYKATADKSDIDLIHLYPHTGTYKPEELELQPMLFPTFCDEGNLFIGLQDCKPGSNLNVLFQLAEATADSESEREELQWYYLENNNWKLLRTGFEILDDDTNGLTTSGIVKFALPANMTNENSILPKGLHWIKAAIPQNSKTVSEIIGIHTQAIKAGFAAAAENDLLRLSTPLPAGSVAKLKEADAQVKKIEQPYDSFGGRIPEAEKHFYIRTSELLRHKNRAIQKFDYERITLEAFPQVFKVKCINHSYALDAHRYVNDFPIAPGYVLIAVIPDLNQLKAARSFEPKAPVSLLESIEATLKKVTSPFVRLRIMNPRYEKVNFCLRVKLLPGKDEVYYKEELKKDIGEFLAPWAIGEYDKLAFGQPINRSDMIRFLESRDYIDYIVDLKMVHAESGMDINTNGDQNEIIPITPRSILVAGSVDVCIDQQDCEQWCECKDATGQQTIPCCDHTAVPLTDYCKETGKV